MKLRTCIKNNIVRLCPTRNYIFAQYWLKREDNVYVFKYILNIYKYIHTHTPKIHLYVCMYTLSVYEMIQINQQIFHSRI